MKFQREIKHNEKVCHAHNLVPTFKVKAAIRGQRSSRHSAVT